MREALRTSFMELKYCKMNRVKSFVDAEMESDARVLKIAAV